MPRHFDRPQNADASAKPLTELLLGLTARPSRRDDVELIEMLWAYHGEDVRRLAFKAIGCQDRASDVAQNVFSDVQRHLQKIGPRAWRTKYGSDLSGLVGTLFTATKYAIIAEVARRNGVQLNSVSMQTPVNEQNGDLTLADVLPGFDLGDEGSESDLFDIHRAVAREVEMSLAHADRGAEYRVQSVLYRLLVQACGYSCEQLRDPSFLALELRDCSVRAHLERICGSPLIRWVDTRIRRDDPVRSTGWVAERSAAGKAFLATVTGRDVAPAIKRPGSGRRRNDEDSPSSAAA